jgi:hypothetical protein
MYHLLPVLALLTLASAQADEKLAGIACRSVHLSYPSEKTELFYNEITPLQSAAGTYFSVCGWDKGYYGMQEVGSGKKLLIFSVWDSGNNDPNAVKEEQRTKLLYKDEKTRIGRFGGEGSGGQSFYDYEWQTNQTYRFLVTAKVSGERTEYAGYFFVPEEKAWRHLVTFSTITGGRLMGGLYAFIEDFRRNKASATEARRARFGNGWTRGPDGAWHALREAKFTADANPALTIDAGIAEGRFFLATGGATTNTGTRLKDSMELPDAPALTPPADLPAKALAADETRMKR